MQEFRLGCAVWSYRGWLGGFYPAGSAAKDFLKLYGDRLHAVEGNTTFYAVPSAETVQRWREQTPEEFRFCLKFPKAVTHEGLLMPRLAEAQAFMERVKPLGDRLSCIFAQLPPSYSPSQYGDLKNFLQTVTQAAIPIGVEVRHPQWFAEPHLSQLDTLLSHHNVTKVLLDTRPIYNCPDNPQAQSQRRKPNLPLYPTVTNHQAIVRFISHPNPIYNEQYLQEWLAQIQQWWSAGKSIQFFVHCPVEDHSPHTAKYFQEQLQAASLQIPPLPWQTLTPEPQQLSLF
ncbi:MAG: DUF72 domain-containing protein [Limnothrix sp.]